MRVIQELVSILRAQGRIDDATLRRLEDGGFIPRPSRTSRISVPSTAPYDGVDGDDDA